MTTASLQAPAASEVHDLMNGLFGLQIKEIPAQTADVFSIAEYVDESGAPVAYLASDLASGCRLGAALTQVPAGRVDEAVNEGAIPDNLAENLYEVFNISVNLVTPEGTRIVLGRVVHGPASDGFAELKEKLEAASRTEYGFDVTRYGACTLTAGV